MAPESGLIGVVMVGNDERKTFELARKVPPFIWKVVYFNRSQPNWGLRKPEAVFQSTKYPDRWDIGMYREGMEALQGSCSVGEFSGFMFINDDCISIPGHEKFLMLLQKVSHALVDHELVGVPNFRVWMSSKRWQTPLFRFIRTHWFACRPDFLYRCWAAADAWRPDKTGRQWACGFEKLTAHVANSIAFMPDPLEIYDSDTLAYIEDPSYQCRPIGYQLSPDAHVPDPTKVSPGELPQ